MRQQTSQARLSSYACMVEISVSILFAVRQMQLGIYRFRRSRNGYREAEQETQDGRGKINLYFVLGEGEKDDV